MLLQELMAGQKNIFRFAVCQTASFNFLFQFAFIQCQKRFRRMVRLKKLRCDNIHSDIGALGGEHGGNQAFEGRIKIQTAFFPAVITIQNIKGFDSCLFVHDFSSPFSINPRESMSDKNNPCLIKQGLSGRDFAPSSL